MAPVVLSRRSGTAGVLFRPGLPVSKACRSRFVLLLDARLAQSAGVDWRGVSGRVPSLDGGRAHLLCLGALMGLAPKISAKLVLRELEALARGLFPFSFLGHVDDGVKG